MSGFFRFLEPTFFAGLIDDPCLLIRDRPIHQSILIDCTPTRPGAGTHSTTNNLSDRQFGNRPAQACPPAPFGHT